MGPREGERRDASTGSGAAAGTPDPPPGEGSARPVRPPTRGVRGEELTVREGTEADAAVAARLHRSQIDEGFLSLLGQPFLDRLYRRIVRSPGSFLLVAEDAGAVVGMVAGTRDRGALYRAFALRDGVAVAVRSAPTLLRERRKVFETLKQGGSGAPSRGLGVELLSIAVDPDVQGRGVGGLLVDALLERARHTGERGVFVVVGADNARALSLYLRSGFAQAAEFELHEGQPSLLLQWTRPPPGPAPRSSR
jgi:ribosomal protein S18 acetylase RimI-like enzyme